MNRDTSSNYGYVLYFILSIAGMRNAVRWHGPRKCVVPPIPIDLGAGQARLVKSTMLVCVRVWVGGSTHTLVEVGELSLRSVAFRSVVTGERKVVIR